MEDAFFHCFICGSCDVLDERKIIMVLDQDNPN